MSRHLLRELTTTAVAQVLSNASCPKGVIADPSLDPRGVRPSANHPVNIRLGHGIGRECSAAPAHSPKWIALEVAGEASGADVGIQISLEIVVAGHLMALAAFLMQPNPSPTTLGVVVLD